MYADKIFEREFCPFDFPSLRDLITLLAIILWRSLKLIFHAAVVNTCQKKMAQSVRGHNV